MQTETLKKKHSTQELLSVFAILFICGPAAWDVNVAERKKELHKVIEK